MKIFIVYAHPEPKSFNGSFVTATVQHLEKQGHEARVSDLYKKNFKATVDQDDFLGLEEGDRLKIIPQSKIATREGKLTPDVLEEQANVNWADLVIFQFPLWGYGMPAILKGWFDRVYSNGWAYGLGPYDKNHFGSRFGEGNMTGKKAILSVTIGGSAIHYSERGIDGPIDALLWPITHGLLFYPNFTVLPSHITYRVDKATEEVFNESLKTFLGMLDNIDKIEPIPFRKQNFGDYEIPSCVLKSGKEKPGTTGFGLHLSC